MNKLLTFALPLALTCVALPASSRVYWHTGYDCHHEIQADACISYSGVSVYNGCGSNNAVVVCPIDASYTNAPTVSQIQLVATDRNPTFDVDCTVQKVNTSGTLQYSGNMKTSGSSLTPQTKNLFPATGQGLAGWRMRCTLPALDAGNVSTVSHYFMQTSE